MFSKNVKLVRQASDVCDHKGWAYYQDARYGLEAIVDTDQHLPAELDIYELRAMGEAVIYLSTKTKTIINNVY